MKTKEQRCKCDLCKRSRRFYRNISKLRKSEREWMKRFYDYVLDFERDAHMEAAWEESKKKNHSYFVTI